MICSTSIARFTIGRTLVNEQSSVLRLQRFGEARQRVEPGRVGEGELGAIDPRVARGARDLVDAELKLGRGRHVELSGELDLHSTFGSLDGDP